MMKTCLIGSTSGFPHNPTFWNPTPIFRYFKDDLNKRGITIIPFLLKPSPDTLVNDLVTSSPSRRPKDPCSWLDHVWTKENLVAYAIWLMESSRGHIGKNYLGRRLPWRCHNDNIIRWRNISWHSLHLEHHFERTHHIYKTEQ